MEKEISLSLGSRKSPCTLTFQGDRIPTKKHPTFAITYMRGRAQKWVEPFLKRYMEDPDDDDNGEIKLWMESMAQFRVEIRRMFGTIQRSKRGNANHPTSEPKEVGIRILDPIPTILSKD